MAKRRQRNTRKSSSKSWLLPALFAIGLLILGGWYMMRSRDDADSTPVEIPHIHGLSFSADGEQLIVPAHTGLVIFENNRWSAPDIPAHDYMGYAGVDNGFFSSGHPGRQSNLANPLGLVKSTDGGRTLTTLAFSGESDFHIMAAGYHNHAVYVLSAYPNSSLSTGVYYTLDEGETWQESALQGLEGDIIQIAVHPTEANQVAFATMDGLFLSNDHGNSFTQASDLAPVAAVSFTPDGEALYFAYKALYRYDLTDQQTTEPLSVPQFAANDFITYIAVSSTEGTLSFATASRDIFLSENAGSDWRQIAQAGQGLNS